VDYEKILSAALDDLEAAAKKLTAATTPQTPLPRPREFIFISRGKEKKVVWPAFDGGKYWLNHITHPGAILGYSTHARAYILSLAQYQPRLILRALRRIQAATAWCEARAEGRRRQAEEILRQQQKAVEALEAEAAMLALK